MSDTTDTMQTFEEAEAVLAEALEGYESRPQQQRLAAAVEDAFGTGHHVVAQAGCGTGKSLGYLIPAALAAANDGTRTVITTATKALQDQVANKDLPFLQEHLGVEFTSAILKGRSNYVCQAKLVDTDTPASNEVKVWIKDKTKSEGFGGEREDIPVVLSDQEWRGITVSSEECPGKKQCPFGDSCYAEEAKAKAKEADIVVVNHALFFTDLMVKEMTDGNASMLDEYDVLVADEAHELEEWGAKMLGARFSEGSVNSLLAEVRSLIMGAFPSDNPGRVAVLDQAAAVSAAMNELFTGTWLDGGEMKPLLPAGRIRGHNILVGSETTPLAEAMIDLANALGSYADAVSALNSDQASDPVKFNRKKRLLVVRSHNATKKFADILIAPFDALVRWVEDEPVKGAGRFGRPDTRKVINTAPIEIGEILDRMIWSKTPAVLVSATMAVQGKFDYIASRLGINNFESLDVGTPFDYALQSGLYIPRDIPAPVKDKRAAWESLSVERMKDLVLASDGRALLLFTSRKQMETAYDSLADRLPYTCLMQGQEGKSNKALAAEFMEDHHSVLFALRSFFTGVDFQGEACSLVVIDKLPFPVPNEPLFEARCELVENRGGSAFNDLTIPVMTLILEQGFGRLIRHRNDRGVVAILDPRLVTSGYGTKIVNSLPPAQSLRDMDDVRAFYAQAKAAA